ncbi:AAA family ATPase [Gloeobacter morelensis]|uniref:AAA family ATPase n=1 Tax=Gloeobacter morelensis MG652769 TaxID=2781736 RepID=A0ABY3PIZ2_9CYAN|nr:AAA family ATPase [Gloeobacter morelensis]UFP93593.1 AAA family ATPase [Gloeobacter morelensis MG652769]
MILPVLTCYLLVAPPAAGKSTLAVYLAERDPALCVVSTDQIRAELYGDARIQGQWTAIEREVLFRVHNAFRSGRPVIYDATNAKRSWRLAFLQQMAVYPNVQWVAWQLVVPVEECLARNAQRERQVPPEVIRAMAREIERFPPVLAEGFVAVHRVEGSSFSPLRAVPGSTAKE